MTLSKVLKLGVVTSHPIQYHTPWFRAMSEMENIDLEVLYCHRASAKDQAAAGFGVEFEWDTSLLSGYSSMFLRNVARIPSLEKFSGLDTPEISSVIETRKYDAVLVSGWNYKSSWQAIRACWRLKIPLMVRSDSHLHTERSPLKTAVKAIPYRWFISKFDACLAVGRWSADYFIHYGSQRDRVFLVPHAIDSLLGRSAMSLMPARSELRKRWELGSKDTVFLFVGKFIAKKRPLDFVLAVQKAAREQPAVMGLMVGDGPLRKDCEGLVKENNIPIRFAGFMNQSEIANAYVAADALVLPSNGGETWGVVANEAMTCGRPCFVSDRVGCGPDLVVSGQTGFIFRVGDIEALASQMTWLATEPNRAISLGAHARNHVRQYSIAAAVQGVEAALSHVVGYEHRS